MGWLEPLMTSKLKSKVFSESPANTKICQQILIVWSVVNIRPGLMVRNGLVVEFRDKKNTIWTGTVQNSGLPQATNMQNFSSSTIVFWCYRCIWGNMVIFSYTSVFKTVTVSLLYCTRDSLQAPKHAMVKLCCHCFLVQIRWCNKITSF